VRQRHEHLLASPLALAHVVFDDRIAAGEPMLLPEPVKHPLGRMALLARNLPIAFQPGIDDWDERIQLRAPDRSMTPIAGRLRIGHHLANAVARYVEMLRRLALAHAFRARQPNLPIKFHGENPQPSLQPAERE
jgi:hypothetical protein